MVEMLDKLNKILDKTQRTMDQTPDKVLTPLWILHRSSTRAPPMCPNAVCHLLLFLFSRTLIWSHLN